MRRNISGWPAARCSAPAQILLIGWDFDARIVLDHDEANDPSAISSIRWSSGTRAGIFLLRWDTGAIKSLFRGRTFFTVMKWMAQAHPYQAGRPSPDRGLAPSEDCHHRRQLAFAAGST
jgi:hypothetical protein